MLLCRFKAFAYVSTMFICSVLEPFSNSYVHDNSPEKDNICPTEVDIVGTENTQHLRHTFDEPRPTNNTYNIYYPLLILWFSILGNDQTDDPYGMFEPIVEQTNLEGTIHYI